MTNFSTSVIRTVVPMIVGAILSYLATQGITVDEEFKANMIIGLTTVLQAAYYIIVRLAGLKWPQVEGVLLGSSKAPVYKKQ